MSVFFLDTVLSASKAERQNVLSLKIWLQNKPDLTHTDGFY